MKRLRAASVTLALVAMPMAAASGQVPGSSIEWDWKSETSVVRTTANAMLGLQPVPDLSSAAQTDASGRTWAILGGIAGAAVGGTIGWRRGVGPREELECGPEVHILGDSFLQDGCYSRSIPIGERQKRGLFLGALVGGAVGALSAYVFQHAMSNSSSRVALRPTVSMQSPGSPSISTGISGRWSPGGR